MSLCCWSWKAVFHRVFLDLLHRMTWCLKFWEQFLILQGEWSRRNWPLCGHDAALWSDQKDNHLNIIKNINKVIMLNKERRWFHVTRQISTSSNVGKSFFVPTHPNKILGSKLISDKQWSAILLVWTGVISLDLFFDVHLLQLHCFQKCTTETHSSKKVCVSGHIMHINNNNRLGVIRCMMRRAARRRITTTHCNGRSKKTGDADLKTSQAHAHGCFRAPTVLEKKKKGIWEKNGDSLFLCVLLPATPVPWRWGDRGLDWRCDGLLCREELHRKKLRHLVVVGPSRHLECFVPCWARLMCVDKYEVKICRPFWFSEPREGSRCVVPDPLSWTAWRDTWRRSRLEEVKSVTVAPMFW